MKCRFFDSGEGYFRVLSRNFEIRRHFFPFTSTESSASGACTLNGPARLNSVTSVLCCADAERAKASKPSKIFFFISLFKLFFCYFIRYVSSTKSCLLFRDYKVSHFFCIGGLPITFFVCQHSVFAYNQNAICTYFHNLYTTTTIDTKSRGRLIGRDLSDTQFKYVIFFMYFCRGLHRCNGKSENKVEPLKQQCTL